MGAKDLHVAPISSRDARATIKRLHYSGKAVNNSQLHLGVFWKGKLEGAMQFGPPMDRRKLLGLVEDTPWHGMMELNRMAFSEALPRNSESRALSVAMRLIRKHYPQIQWVVSFADATQCGDGTIYRASGFVLTGIRPNKTIYQMPSGELLADITVNTTKHILKDGAANAGKKIKEMGGNLCEGYQLRYIRFLDPTALARLTVPVLPFSRIAELNAGMYRGKPTARAKQAMAGPPAQRRGSTDRHAPAA